MTTNNMDKEITAILDELKLVNMKLEESEALKSHFISNVTNEIINPFSSILGLSKNIMLLESKDIKKIYAMSRLIYLEAFNLDFQLKNIFATAKLEAGESRPEIMTIEVDSIIRSVIDSFQYNIDQKQLEVIYSCDGCVGKGDHFTFVTDPEMFRLIVSNLVSNSIKFSSAANKIEIRAKRNDDSINVSVRDYGAGIDKKNLKKIFDRFKRLDGSINSIKTGHGLGLSVSKALLDILEGKISINTMVNSGSTFIISIPEAKQIDGMDAYASDANELFFDDGDEF